jgi:hypothetical protein
VLTDIAGSISSTSWNAMGNGKVFTNVAGVYCVDHGFGGMGCRGEGSENTSRGGIWCLFSDPSPLQMR